MSFIAAATTIGFTGTAATIAAGAMMGGTMTVGMNVVQGRDPFDNLAQGMLMGGFTAGISPFVGEALGVSANMATGITAGALGYAESGDIGKGLVAGLSAYGLAEMSGNLEAAGGEKLAGAETAARAETAANVARIAPNSSTAPATTGMEAYKPYSSMMDGAGNPIPVESLDISPVDSAVASNANTSLDFQQQPQIESTGSVNVDANVGPQQLSTATFDADIASSATPRVSTKEYTDMLRSQGMSDEAIRAKLSDAGKEVVGSDLKSAGKFIRGNAKNLMYATAPIFADTGVQNNMPKTVTKPGMIRPYSFDPYSGRYTAGNPYEATPIKAAEGGLMAMADGGYNPGQLDFTQRSEPVARMASGGIVALAAGGAAGQPLYLGLDKGSSAADVAAAYSQFAGGAGGDTATNQREAVAFLQSRGIGDDVIKQGYQQFLSPAAPVTAQSYLTANPDVAAAFKDNNYGLTADQFAQVHFNKYGQYEDRAAPVMANVAPAAIPQSAYSANAGASGASHFADGVQLVPGAPGYDPAKAAMRLAEISTYGGVAGAGAADTLRANNLYDTGMSQWQTEYNRLHQQDIDAGRVPVGTPATKVGVPTATSGLSAAAQYSLLNSDVGVGADKVGGLRGLNSLVLDFLKQYPNATQAEIAAAKKLYGYNDADVVRPYEHGYQLASGQEAAAQKYLQDNPDVKAWLNTSEGKDYLKNNPTFDAADIAYTHYKRYGEKEGRKWGLPVSTVVPPVNPIDTAVNLPGGVSGGGTTVVNPNGTITTRPNIPGMPEGGFTGMGQVRDAYTAGGGSLGYTPYTPKIEEFDNKYTSRLTGGSKQSYDYLTGKKPYSPTPYTPTGEVQKPYAESVLGMPTPLANKLYLFDPVTKTYKINPDYAIGTKDDKGKVSYSLTNKDVAEYVATAPTDTEFLAWANTNNLSAEQIAAATGMPISEVYKRLKKGKPVEEEKVVEPTSDANMAANGGLMGMAAGGMAGQYNLGSYSDGGRLLRGPGDGVSDSIPATIGNKRPARLADGEFVVPARIVSELGNGSTEAGARKLYAMMDRVQAARRGTVGKKKVAKNSRADKYLPA